MRKITGDQYNALVVYHGLQVVYDDIEDILEKSSYCITVEEATKLREVLRSIMRRLDEQHSNLVEEF